MPKRILSGTVISSNSDKTIVVKVTRRVKHKLYKKIISLSKNYHVHDEDNQFKSGDKISIIESKPISKLIRDLCVCAPQYLSIGTSIYPIVSFSFLVFIITNKKKKNTHK